MKKTCCKKEKNDQYADISCFSFYPAKNLGAFGDAGAIITDDEALAKDIAGLRNWADDDVGHNYRMASIQAEVLRVKLQKYSDVLSAKEEIADYYQENFVNYLMYKKACGREEKLKKIWK